MGSCVPTVVNRGYSTLYISLNMILIIVAVVLYLLVLRQAWKHLAQVSQHLTRFQSSLCPEFKQEIARSRFTWLVLGVFILCWCPFSLISLVNFFTSNPTIEFLHDLALALGILNSVLNCIIYGLRSRDFQLGLKKMLNTCPCLNWLPQPLGSGVDGTLDGIDNTNFQDSCLQF